MGFGIAGFSSGFQGGVQTGLALRQAKEAEKENQYREEERQRLKLEREGRKKLSALMTEYLLKTDGGTKDLSPQEYTDMFKRHDLIPHDFIDHDQTGRKFSHFEGVATPEGNKMVAVLKEGDGRESVMSFNRSSDKNDPYIGFSGHDLLPVALAQLSEKYGVDTTPVAQLITKARHGEIVKVVPTRDKKTGRIIYAAINKDGSVRPFDLEYVDTSSTKNKPVVVGKSLVDPRTGKVLYRDTSGGKDNAGLVVLRNGQKVKESDLRQSYFTQFGKKDPLGNLVPGDNAPDYTEWRNSIVAPEYRWNTPSRAANNIDLDKAISIAQEEADARDPLGPNILRPDATRKAYGGLTRDEWIHQRALQILNQAKGGVGIPQTQPAQPAQTTQPAQPAQTTQQEPMPDPVANKGRVLIDRATGKRYQSDGTRWVEVQ